MSRDAQCVQELLVREAGWGWRAGLGKESVPGGRISVCKGPEAGGIVTLSGHQKEDWCGAQGGSPRWGLKGVETQAS